MTSIAGKTYTKTVLIPGDPTTVFDALTDPTQLQVWFAEHVDVESRAGGRYQFWGRHTIWCEDESDANQYITRFEPARALGFHWQWVGHASDVLIELTPERDGTTQLSLRHAFPGCDRYPPQCDAVTDFWPTALGNLRHFVRTGKAALLPDIRGETDGSCELLVLTIEIEAPPHVVFESLMNPALLNQWIGSNAVVEPHVGGQYSYGWTKEHGGETTLEGPSRIVRLEPNRLLETDWNHRPMNSDPTVRWELDATATGTRVTLSHRGFPTADDHRDHALGWTAYLVSLEQTAMAHAVQNQQA